MLRWGDSTAGYVRVDYTGATTGTSLIQWPSEHIGVTGFGHLQDEDSEKKPKYDPFNARALWPTKKKFPKKPQRHIAYNPVSQPVRMRRRGKR